MTDDDRASEPEEPDSLALPHMPPQLPDLSSLRFLGGEDLSEHFRRLEENAQRRTGEGSAPLPPVLPDFVAPSAEDSLELGEEGEDLLDDARANIARGEYTLALEQLAQFLEISPGHPEARYLQAYCHYRLGGPGPMSALGILRPMRDERLEDPELRACVQELRSELRRTLTSEEVAAFVDAFPRDPHAAADRLRRFIELAPEEPEPPYLLAVAQARDGEFESALRTAQAGLKEAEGDTLELQVLADVLAMVVVRPLARRAARALRDGAYRRARGELARLDSEWRETEVLRDLDAFLTDLCRSGHPSAKPLPTPRGSADRVARLYTLIFDEDGRHAVELLNAERFAEAERVLAKILHVVPGFPPPNYLYAICLCVQGREPERAIAAAEIAARDPSIPDTELLLRTAREMPEVLAINAAVEEHNAAVESVTGNPSRKELLALRRTMHGLRERVPELRSIATTRQNTRRVRKLARAVDQRLTEIEQAMENVEVSELVQRFNRWAEQAVAERSPSYGDGLLGRATGRSFPGSYLRWSPLDPLSELTEIAQEARRLQRTATDLRTRQVLQDLLDAIDRIIR